MPDTNPYEANRGLFEELAREQTAATTAVNANDMDAWLTHAESAAQLYLEIAYRLGWRARPASPEGETK